MLEPTPSEDAMSEDAMPKTAVDLALIAALVTAVLYALVPTISWTSGAPHLALPVLNDGALGDRVAEAFHLFGYLGVAGCAAAGALLPSLRRVAAIGALVLLLLFDVAGTVASVAVRFADVPSNPYLLEAATRSGLSLLVRSSLTLVVALVGVRSARPLGLAGTLGLLLLAPLAMIPTGLVFDVYLVLTGLDADLLGWPLALLSYVFRPVTVLLVLPLALRAAFLRTYAFAWPGLLAASGIVATTVSIAADNEPHWWTIGVYSASWLLGTLVAFALGRALGRPAAVAVDPKNAAAAPSVAAG